MSPNTNPVIVECILKRENTVVEIEGDTYQFRRDASGRYVAVVSNMDHVSRFAAAPEGYRIVGMISASALEAAQSLGATKPAKPEGPAIQDDENTAGTNIATIPTAADPDGNTPDPGQAGPQGAETTTKSDQASEPADLAAMSDDDLRATFEAEVGRKPHVRAGRDTLISQIMAVRAPA